jgi:2-C-methyl-D-erythritol 4-phosphate cytidylyltransferase
VKKGLELINDGCIVGIHDAVRPFVSQATIERCYSTAAAHGSAIPVLDMNESVRITRGELGSMQMDRSKLKRVQTPQVFRSEMIRQAYQQASESSYTDDASVFESAFGLVTLVKGNPENIKITTNVDLELAKILIRQR